MATTKGQHAPPPVPDVELASETLAVPNRERLIYLTHLANRFRPMPGLSASFGYRGFEVVLYVVTTSSREDRIPGTPEPPIAGVTVRCVYHEGQWWFARGGDGSRFTTANDLGTAANVVRRAIEKQIADGVNAQAPAEPESVRQPIRGDARLNHIEPRYARDRKATA